MAEGAHDRTQHTLSVRLDKALVGDAREMAAWRGGMSLAAYIRHALARSIAADRSAQRREQHRGARS